MVPIQIDGSSQSEAGKIFPMQYKECSLEFSVDVKIAYRAPSNTDKIERISFVVRGPSQLSAQGPNVLKWGPSFIEPP